jgi:hypothetical protein
MTEQISHSFETKAAEGVRGRAHDGAIKDSGIKASRRLPDKPWKYNPPPPAGIVRPKPVLVPKSK